MRKKVHPGKIIKNHYLTPENITEESLALEIDVPLAELTSIINETAPITEDIAVKLANYFNTSVGLWKNLQTNYDKY